MKKKVTKSFALDVLTLESIQEIKEELNLKNDSEVVTYAIFDLLSDIDVMGIKERIEELIARKKYSEAISNTVRLANKLK